MRGAVNDVATPLFWSRFNQYSVCSPQLNCVQEFVVMSEGIVNPECDDKPTHGSDTDIVATVDENASDSNSVKSAALVDLHACGICYQLYNDSDRLPKVLSCGHTNCLSCLNSWQKHGSSPFPICAVCRKVTRRPIVSLPNNFQLLQVLRRMKLISTNSEPETSAEQRKSTTQVEEMAPGITSVCEQIDEHMSEVASLLESQLDHLNSMSTNDEHPYATEFDRLLRIVESASADLISHWEVTKRHLLHTKKAKSRTSSSVPPVFSIPGLSDFFGIGRHFDEIRTDSASDDPFDRIHDFLGLDSDTPPNAYSEFSLFGSETSHETAVSASEASSQDNENYSTVIEPREESPFLHISLIQTFDGTFGSYSYCSLCHCRLPTNTDSHRTHVLGRRHQSALGHTTDSSVTDAMRFLGLHVNRNRQPRRPRTTPLSFARRFADILHSQHRASTPETSLAQLPKGLVRHTKAVTLSLVGALITEMGGIRRKKIRILEPTPSIRITPIPPCHRQELVLVTLQSLQTAIVHCHGTVDELLKVVMVKAAVTDAGIRDSLLL
ncbi:unnamed protein product, partial [Haemonchus placei]|uniref:RING-type domain-containing protein n=1 Tax=Haemonchus placei TaxID=6290 RepID=A0A0N4X3T9_HAEPC